MRRILSVVLFFAVAITAPGARAGDSWAAPYDGLKWLERTTTSPNWQIHALVVDLTVPGVSLTVTTYDQRGQTTSSFGQLVNAQAATNGDFFLSDFSTVGFAVGRGVPFPGSNAGDGSEGSLLFSQDVSRVELARVGDPPIPFDPSWMWGAVSGHPNIVVDGVAQPDWMDPSNLCGPNPRTMLGISQDKNTLYLAVVDGRSAQSVGMTCAEQGTLMAGLGAWNALNLDGGGSSTMWLASAGVLNAPSDGTERAVGNHLAIFAPDAGTVATIQGTVHAKANGAAIAGAQVTLQGTSRFAATDTGGAYSMLTLPGTLQIVATKTGYLTVTTSKTVSPGQSVTIDFELENVGGPIGGDAGTVDGGRGDGAAGGAQVDAAPGGGQVDAAVLGSAQDAAVKGGAAPGGSSAGCGCGTVGSLPRADAIALAALGVAVVAAIRRRRREAVRSDSATRGRPAFQRGAQ
jgi:hypothetical protein